MLFVQLPCGNDCIERIRLPSVDVTIGFVKQRLVARVEISVGSMVLRFNGGNPLDDDSTLRQNQIGDQDVVLLSVTTAPPSPGMLQISANSFEPGFNKLYPHSDDQGFFRGNQPYHRPLSCYRFGLRVLGRYDGGNNTWLGPPPQFYGNPRYENHPNEWPVSFTGTSRENAQRTVVLNYRERYDPLRCNHDQINPDRYVSTYDVIRAQAMATTFSFENEDHYVILQNRIFPTFTISEDGGFLLTKKKYHLRPYGILVKRREPAPSIEPPL